MGYPVFQVPAGDVLPVMFSSYAGATGASVTLTGLAVTDIEIYKDGSVTQRASDAGYTLLDTDGIDFDGITGIHGFSIDTSDNTDAGFYTVGAWFTVVVSAVTVDSQTVNFIACQFRLMAAESVAGKPKVDVDAWLGTAAATPTVAGVPEVDVTHFNGTAGTFSSGRPEVNTTHVAGTAQTAKDIGAAVPAAAAGASGGLLISGSNSGTTTFGALTVTGTTTFTGTTVHTGNVSYADGITVAAPSTLNRAGVDIAGNGTGSGLALTGGATGAGLLSKGGGTSGVGASIQAQGGASRGLQLLGSGAGQGLYSSGGSTGDGVYLTGGGTSGAGLQITNGTGDVVVITAVAGNGDAIQLAGQGTGTGLRSNIIGDITGNLSGSAGSVTGAVGSVTAAVTVGTISANVITASALATDAVDEIVDAVWDEATAGHATAGTTGKALTDAGSAGDPWATALPGAYGAGTAGKIVGDNVNATISSRSSHSAADVWAVGTRALTDKANFTLAATYDFAKGTTAVTESYATNGAAPTPVQAIMAIHQMLMQFAISSTTYTVKKLDNSTTAFVVTLDSATTPTSAVRT